MSASKPYLTQEISSSLCSAFSNARKLAQEGVAPSIVDVLNMLWEEQPTGNEAFQISCHLCTALKVLAANDDICKELVFSLITAATLCKYSALFHNGVLAQAF
jgi:hypothetical protein